MKTTKMFRNALLVFSMSVAGSMAMATPVLAKMPLAAQPFARLPNAVTLADNVVVAPQGASAQPTPAPAPAQVNVQPAPPAQVNVQPAAPAAQPAPLVEQPRKVVHVEAAPTRNYMSTVFVSALMGGLAGALVGGAIYYLDNQDHPINIAYWAAGGVLLGTGVGVTQVIVQENRSSDAMAMNRLPSDPTPTYRLALFRARF